MRAILSLTLASMLIPFAAADATRLKVDSVRHMTLDLRTGKREPGLRGALSTCWDASQATGYFAGAGQDEVWMDWGDLGDGTPATAPVCTLLGSFEIGYATNDPNPQFLDVVFYTNENGFGSQGRVIKATFRLRDLPGGDANPDDFEGWIVHIVPAFLVDMRDGMDLDGDGLLDFGYSWNFRNSRPPEIYTGPLIVVPNSDAPGWDDCFDVFAPDPNLPPPDSNALLLPDVNTSLLWTYCPRNPEAQFYMRLESSQLGPCGPACAGADLDRSCIVDLADLALMLSNYGGASLDPNDGDTDYDGDVDLVDLSIALGVFGTVCDGAHALDVSPMSLQVAEGGTGTFSVALAQDPGVPVLVRLRPDADRDPDITVESGAVLHFDSSNYATPQTVTLRAYEDADHGSGLARIHVEGAGFVGVVVAARETDNDYFVVSPSPVIVPEGGTTTFTVALPAAPTEPLTANVVWSGDPDIQIVSTPTLLFDATNFDSPQEVTVFGAEDADGLDGVGQFSVAGSYYRPQSVQGREQDADQIVLSTSSVAVPEGGTATFEVWLADAPTDPITVAVERSGGDQDLSVVSGGLLAFDANNYAAPQTVTLRAAEDFGPSNDAATFQASATGYGSRTLNATEIDDDPMLVITPLTLTVPEGGTNSFTVAFSWAPEAPVAVEVTRLGGDSNISVLSGGSVVFDASFFGPHTVVLAAAEDADSSNGITVFRVNALPADQGLVTATELDND